VPAYFALKLNDNEDVQDYSIENNAQNFGIFDDVVINITKKNKKKMYFALQLKHKKNTGKLLTSVDFEKYQKKKKNQPFYLKKYCESFKKLDDAVVNKQRQFILYTNAKVDPNSVKKVTNFTMIPDDRCDENMLFNTSPGGGNIYRFEVNDKTPEDGNITKSDYKNFFSRFKLFVCQKNVQGFEEDVTNHKIWQKNENKVYLKYVDIFRKCHQDQFTNRIIDKMTVNLHLIDISLSQCINNHHFLVAQDKKLKLFEKVVAEFDVTLINDSFKNFAENLVKASDLNRIDECLKELYRGDLNRSLNELIKFGQKYKILDKRSVNKLKPEMKLKLLQYSKKKPLIVNFNEDSEVLIYKLMELHQLGRKIKFILVGQGIQSAKLSRFRIFENVKDLRSNHALYREVTRTCRLSLQGRMETTLEELIDSCEQICEYVGAKEVHQMLKGTLSIGQALESLPLCYVKRKVCFKVEKIDAILDSRFFEKHLVVVKFDRNVKKIEDEIRKCDINVVNVNDYLKSTQVSKEPTIISTNEDCSKQLLKDVLKKSDNKSVVDLRIYEANGFLVISIGENQLHCLTGSVNILCADLGMGKTTMLKKLRNKCDSRFWTIYVDLKIFNTFFNTEHDAKELLNHLSERNEEGFSKQIRDVFLSNKKVYFFFDGLDEVEDAYVDKVLNSVKELSSEGFHIWISSRKNLKTKLEHHFEKVAMNMEEIQKDKQKDYIKHFLKKEYNDEQIENLFSEIVNKSDISNNCQVLGNALQLHIITQDFLGDKELHKQMTEHTFTVTKLYDLLFRGRFKHSRDKEGSKNPHLSLIDPEEILEKHELVAAHSVFGEEVFKKLDVDVKRTQRFLKQIEKNKDPLGIVTKVNKEGKAVFEHFIYGEYFAARLFANEGNFHKARLIREELFSDGRKNLMMILNIVLAKDNPLHLAVIYRNVDQIGKDIEDKRQVLDIAGRNPLHVATYIEPRYVDLNSCTIEVSTKVNEYLTNISILKKMTKYNCTDCDELFQWNALKYAFENKSFISVEMILKKCEYSNDELRQHTKKYINNDNLILFCLTHGCSKLLSSILENSERNTNYFEKNAWIIIEHTIKNCYVQENETLRFVIETLQQKYHFDVDSTNERGETVLDLAAKYGKTYALLERKAPTNINLSPLNGAA
jgi:hypothetical protein